MRAGQRRAGLWRMLGRALLRRCPRCGGRGWFTGWFGKGDRCVSCGYRYEREEGFLLGPLIINTVLTFAMLAAVLVAGLVATAPEFATIELAVIGAAVGVLAPVALYPLTYMIWAAIDLAVHPLDAAEEADAIAWLAARER